MGHTLCRHRQTLLLTTAQQEETLFMTIVTSGTRQDNYSMNYHFVF